MDLAKDKKGIYNGVAYHLSRIRVDDDIPIDDFLPTKNVYHIDDLFIGCIGLTDNPSIDSDDPIEIDAENNRSIDAKDTRSIDIAYEQQIETSSNTITVDLTVHVSCDPLKPNPDPPRDNSLSLGVHAIDVSLKNRPWYADIVNDLAADVEPADLQCYSRKKFFREVRRYH